ncbi:MAG: hypothetical protein Q8J88_01040 [Bacteroidales bacterium]|nr:hypothetical protein [Bacteroidales bacterium]
MKDFENIKVQPDTQLVAQVQKEFKLLGSLKLYPGHSLFAFNTKTAHLRKVNLKKDVMLGMDGSTITKSKAFQEPDTVYATALNAKNALKKILKSFIQFQNQSL